MNRFAGSRVVVTGAGHGIGRACALRMAGEGARIAALDLDLDAARATAVEVGGRAFPLDLTSRASVDAAFAAVVAEFGGLDVLAHTAGGGVPESSFEDSSDEEWLANLDLNLLGSVRCCRAAMPHLRAAPASAIVLVSSINALAGLGADAYSAAKAGLGALVLNLAAQGAGEGVRVNAVAPGTVRTRVWKGDADARSDWYPLGRVGEPDDVAAAVAFLASGDAAWITGHTLPVDGGFLVNAR